jgi:type VI secretion system protein ImpF
LRTYVCRDIARLLNSTSIDATIDLESTVYVKQSVLNYGMQTPSGKSVSAIDKFTMARMVEAVVRTYEPRLRKVRVSPDEDGPGSDPHEIAFRIDCELWNQPAPNQLILRTRINTESGRARVDDSGGTGAWIQD